MKKFLWRLSTSITLLMLIVCCNCEIEDEVQAYVNSSGIIDEIFKPEKMIGKGSFGRVWKGDLDLNKVNAFDLNIEKIGANPKSRSNSITSSTSLETRNWKTIAMKISKRSNRFKREFKLFARLLAYKNETVDNYGIPTVWYRGAFMEKYYAIGMTLCETSIFNKFRENGGKLEPINLLVVFYQVLRSLKYIHGKEIIHQDLKADNFLVKGAQLYLIDFNIADWIHERNYPDGGNRRYSSVTYYIEDLKGFYMDDLRSLFYVMLELAGIPLPWKDIKDLWDVAELKINFLRVRNLCYQFEHTSIRKLFMEYYSQVMPRVKNLLGVKEDKRIFKYNAMGNKILNVIQELTYSRYPFFTWLSPDEITEGENNFIPIESVSGPTPIDGFSGMVQAINNTCHTQ